MKTPFKNPATPLTMLIMVLAMALTFSCSKEEVDDFLNGSSSSNDANQGGGGSSSSGGGGSSPSSSSVANISSASVVDNDILGSCTGLEVPDSEVCTEFLVNNDIGDANTVQQSCIEQNGIWNAGSVCPAGWTRIDSVYTAPGVIAYYYFKIEIPDNAILLTSDEWQWTQGNIAVEGGEVWYKFPAVADRDYYIGWHDLYSPEENDAFADIVVNIYDSEGNLIFQGDDMEHTLNIISLDSDGMVYIRVIRISEEGASAFEIKYNYCDGACG